MQLEHYYTHDFDTTYIDTDTIVVEGDIILDIETGNMYFYKEGYELEHHKKISVNIYKYNELLITISNKNECDNELLLHFINVVVSTCEYHYDRAFKQALRNAMELYNPLVTLTDNGKLTTIKVSDGVLYITDNNTIYVPFK